MLSKALSHFPQFRFRDGQKRLWNPVLKKTFVNLPEERVRLSLIDYLLLDVEFSMSRISFESPVKLAGDKSSSRTDIICYDKNFKPLLLVECKAPDIKLDEKAAIQVARYNQKVGAPFVLVSNGMLDFWFEFEGEQIQFSKDVPAPFQPQKEAERSLRYWEERGFIGEKLHPEARAFAQNSCIGLFSDPHQPIKFLNFDTFPPDFALGHYYRIFGLGNKVKIGISLSANPFGGTRLNAVLNRDGENTAFCTSSLDLLAEKEPVNTEIHSALGQKEVDLRNEITFSFENDMAELPGKFHALLGKHS